MLDPRRLLYQRTRPGQGTREAQGGEGGGVYLLADDRRGGQIRHPGEVDCTIAEETAVYRPQQMHLPTARSGVQVRGVRWSARMGTQGAASLG